VTSCFDSQIDGDLSAVEHEFRVLITADQGIEYQQNTKTLPVTIIVLIAHRTRVDDLKHLVRKAVTVLESNPAIGVYHIAV